MTQVFPVGSAATSAAPKPAAGSNTVDQDTFLKLLVAQLKYQDPMSPTDSTQFLTQTAQFTQLETLQKIQQEQQTLATSSQTLAAATMVGRSVSYSLAVDGKTTTPTPTNVVSVRGALPKDAAT